MASASLPLPAAAPANPSPPSSSSSSSSSDSPAPQQQPSRGARIYKTCKPILAGGMTGAIETLILYPTEYVKTHLQLQGNMISPAGAAAVSSAGGSSSASAAAASAGLSSSTAYAANASTAASSAAAPSVRPPPPQHLVYTGMTDCYLKTIKHKGFFGLYQGMGPYIVGAIPKQATRWGVFESCASTLNSFKRHVLLRDEAECQRSKMSLAEVSACGLVAGAMEAMIAAVPMDTIKTRLIDDAKAAQPLFQNKPLYASVALMIRLEGIRGVYKGVGGTVMKQSVNQMVRFPVQQATMNVFCSGMLCGGSDELSRRRRKSPFWNGFAGFIAGVVSVFMSQPFDVVKTRMQSQTGARYKGSADCFRTIIREDGWSKMYSGCVPRCMRVGGNVALTFTLFPVIKGML